MPYKDPNRKKEWERIHRQRRLLRRRELRKFEVASERTPPSVEGSLQESASQDFRWPLVAAGAGLAAYSPPLALALGSLAFVVATVRRQDWRWQVIGAVVVVLAIFFLWLNRSDESEGRTFEQDTATGQET